MVCFPSPRRSAAGALPNRPNTALTRSLLDDAKERVPRLKWDLTEVALRNFLADEETIGIPCSKFRANSANGWSFAPLSELRDAWCRRYGPMKWDNSAEVGPNDISLDLLRTVYRANHLPLTTRMRAAISALPHEVPKLIATAVMNENSFSDLLDRRLKRIEQRKLLENKTITGEKIVSEPKLIEEPKPAPPMAPALNRLYNKKLYRRI